MVKRVTLADIARETGFSIVTVGKVLNQSGGKNARVSEKSSEIIRQCAERHGYVANKIASQLAGKKVISSPFCTKVILRKP